MNIFLRKRYQGFTIIEMMVALSVLAILLAFATPALQNSAARSDIKQATDQVAQAFARAKNAARINNSGVKLTLSTNESNNTITFEFLDAPDADKPNIAASGESLPDVRLPGKISVTAAISEFNYNPMGMIDATGTVTLASTTNPDFSSTVAVNTLLGHVTANINYGEEEEEAS
jgi:prepilin-type N-terminal cleavage/methylation domain-containing protein